jgi:hypothetical protein
MLDRQEPLLRNAGEAVETTGITFQALPSGEYHFNRHSTQTVVSGYAPDSILGASILALHATLR